MSDRFHRYVLHNLGLKLISVGLASALWLAVSRNPAAEVAIEVPIEFRNVPEDLEISSPQIPPAQIRLRGPAVLVNRLQHSDVRAEIDLGEAKPGERTFQLTALQVRKPYGLDVVQVVPSQIQLAFDTRLTRQVGVHPRVIGAFAEGYGIAKVVVVPPMVVISGPRGRVESADAAITDPVDVSGAMDRATFVTHAYVADPMVQVVDSAPIHVTVIMEKTSAPREKQ